MVCNTRALQFREEISLPSNLGKKESTKWKGIFIKTCLFSVAGFSLFTRFSAVGMMWGSNWAKSFACDSSESIFVSEIWMLWAISACGFSRGGAGGGGME
eukprot:4371860-Amphidinium_carterae.1